MKRKEMSDAQPYIAIGFPSFVVLAGILVNVGYSVSLNGSLSRVEGIVPR
jgi:hypothetical protein